MGILIHINLFLQHFFKLCYPSKTQSLLKSTSLVEKLKVEDY